MKAETIFKLTIIPVHALYQNLYTKSDQHSIGQAGNVGLTDSSSCLELPKLGILTLF